MENNSQEQRIMNLDIIASTAGIIGGIIGIIYAHRTGGKALRYVGYFFLGSIILGLIATIAVTPAKNKILKEGNTESE